MSTHLATQSLESILILFVLALIDEGILHLLEIMLTKYIDGFCYVIPIAFKNFNAKIFLF